MTQPKTVLRTLPRLFTQEELVKMKDELIKLIEDEEELQIRRKLESNEYTAKFKEMKKVSRQLAHNLKTKQIDVDVECKVTYNFPEPNMKTITRTDTGEDWEEPMSEVEKQEELDFEIKEDDTPDDIVKRLAKENKEKKKVAGAEAVAKNKTKSKSKEYKKDKPSDKEIKKAARKLADDTQRMIDGATDIEKVTMSSNGGVEITLAEKKNQPSDEEFNKDNVKPKKFNVFEDKNDMERFLFEIRVPGTIGAESEELSDEEIELLKDKAVDYAKDIELKVNRDILIFYPS